MYGELTTLLGRCIRRIAGLDCSTANTTSLSSCTITYPRQARDDPGVLNQLRMWTETNIRRTLDNKTDVVVLSFGDLYVAIFGPCCGWRMAALRRRACWVAQGICFRRLVPPAFKRFISLECPETGILRWGMATFTVELGLLARPPRRWLT